MLLNKVKIRNFRQLVDVDLDFAKDDGKTFTIIQGDNGTGKTTFLNALSWCLYGRESYSINDTKKGLNICNEEVRNLATIGDEIEVRVEIEFLDEDRQPLSFDRVQRFIKTKNEKNNLRQSYSNFEMKTREGNDIKIHNNPTYTIEKKIPEEIKKYFFFKGEDLSNYFDNTKDEDIKEAVYEISQLNLLEKVQKNLPRVKQKYVDQLAEIDPKLGEATRKVNELTQKIEESEEKLSQLENDKKEISNEINAIFEELLENNSVAVKKDARRTKELDRKIESHNKSISKLEVKIRENVLTNYPYVLSYEYFKKFIELGDESIEKGEIPPQIKRSYIEELLKKGKCICGADLNEDESHRKALEELLEKTKPLTDNAEDLTTAVSEVKHHILKDLKKFKAKNIEQNQKRNKLNKEKKEFISEKKEIEARLKLYSEEKIDNLMARKKALEDSKENIQHRIPNLKSSIERDKKSLGEWRKKANKEDALFKESQRLKKKIKVCDNSIIAATDLYNSLKEEMREKIQRFTRENFLKISYKEGAFTDIVIHEDYSVGIINSQGTEFPPFNLSGGEYLTLGLCFMAALHNISGFDLPIIMDAPSSVLGDTLVYNVAAALPELNKDKQFVLLVLDKDYLKFKNTLNTFIGKDYLIEWEGPKEGSSKVISND